MADQYSLSLIDKIVDNQVKISTYEMFKENQRLKDKIAHMSDILDNQNIQLRQYMDDNNKFRHTIEQLTNTVVNDIIAKGKNSNHIKQQTGKQNNKQTGKHKYNRSNKGINKRHENDKNRNKQHSRKVDRYHPSNHHTNDLRYSINNEFSTQVNREYIKLEKLEDYSC